MIACYLQSEACVCPSFKWVSLKSEYLATCKHTLKFVIMSPNGDTEKNSIRFFKTTFIKALMHSIIRLHVVNYSIYPIYWYTVSPYHTTIFVLDINRPFLLSVCVSKTVGFLTNSVDTNQTRFLIKVSTVCSSLFIPIFYVITVRLCYLYQHIVSWEFKY